MDIPTRLLLAFVAFGTDIIELLVIPPRSFEAANSIGAPLLVNAYRQCFYPQIKGYHTRRFAHLDGPLSREGRVVVTACISTDRHFFELLWRRFCETGHHIRKALWPMPAATAGGQADLVAFDLEVHGRIHQREEAMAGPYPRETRRFARF